MIAVVAVGVAAFLVSQLSGPKRGTVEWHKREYLKAYKSGMLAMFVDNHAPAGLQDAYWSRRHKRIEFHRQALIDAGVLGERVFIVSNRPPREVAKAFYEKMYDVFVYTNDPMSIPGIRDIGPDSVTVVGLADQMDKWNELIRKADVAENGK